ncbi:MAG: RluA family pseudouridine synthase [Clostridia bacterium]
MQIPVLYQEERLLVCVKPAGLLSERGGLPELLERQCGGQVWPVHRLDREVGGVMVYARSRGTAAALSALIAARRMEKEYLAVVEGKPEAGSGELRDLLYHDAAKNKSYVVKRKRKGVKQASLSYRLLETAETEQGSLSLLRVRLHTGRSHQIRVQFASRRLPLAGDARYGARHRGGIALWSASLRFPDPDDGSERLFRAPPPGTWPWDLFGLHNV